MAVREFDGTSDRLKLSVGSGLGACTYGTFAALYKVTDNTTVRSIFVFLNSSNNFAWGPLFVAGDDTMIFSGSSDVHTSTATPQGVWVTMVVRKATGTATPRFSYYNHTTATWTHANGTGTTGNGTAPTSGFIHMSTDGSGAEVFQGRLAVTAAWNNTVKWSADASGDSAIEAAGLHTSLNNWVSAAPTALWPWNPLVATGITDSMGTGADQVTINGTTQVVGDDPDGFSFTLGSGPSGDAYQWTPRQFAAPVPRVFRTGIRAPLQLQGDKATPFQGTDATVTAVAIVTTTGAPAPTLQTGSTVSAIAIAAPVALPAPTVQTGSSFTATAIATITALPAPALQTGSTVAGVAIDTTTVVPPPTVVVPAVTDPYQFSPGRAPMFYDLGRATQVLGDRTSPVSASDATVAAVAVATTTALSAPALQTGSTVATTDVVTTASLPAPTLQTGSTVLATAIDTTTAMSAPSVVAGAAADPVQFLPGRAPMFYDIGKATQLQGDRTILDATIAATVINTVTALDAPVISAVAGTDQYQAGPQIAGMFLAPELASFQLQGDASTGASASSDATVTPPSITTTAALPAPALQTGSTVSATTLATVTTLPAASLSTGSTVAGTAIATVTALPAPAIQTAGNITVAATSIATVTDLPAPSVQQGQTVSGTTIATVTSISAPTIIAGNVISPATIATVTSLPAPTVQTGQTVSAVTLATVTTLPTPTVIGTFDGIKGTGGPHGSSTAPGSVYPPRGSITGTGYSQSDGGIIGQAG